MLQTYLGKTKNGFQESYDDILNSSNFSKMVDTELSNNEFAAEVTSKEKLNLEHDDKNEEKKSYKNVILRRRANANRRNVASYVDSDEEATKRHSKVLENIKMFEAFDSKVSHESPEHKQQSLAKNETPKKNRKMVNFVKLFNLKIKKKVLQIVKM